ncbi:gamma interferon inducible lysosomal thiol reductase (GILT) protein [Toxoplasma gondii ME49]|uniref:Gamma interferon inducible lysosomal thiol reductase (GILT) protein n=1 Tax=Toxoplasma gondii (strain ATCC 50611 / Me49) TaxID=508771 RepID=S8F4H6_TOXGM|nr:gamma interferon inducible lysosomal thiol reductase (GILT) protein [Toxoplasma gondii ME49]EPT29587.1 gamma interferon inducible lysosomal thiol reductase (GILT) protein [Toxoplasma gondii ME49]|eukprot:XP_018637102.1 gamma interferon inducible lysosomal thiol reductase (GILT) protein [Toxoplasma gondii ME49]
MKLSWLPIWATATGSCTGVCAASIRVEPRHNHSQHNNRKNDRVKVDIMYESMCPFCQRLITQQLSHIMKSDIADYIDLRLYPYGNALERGGEIACQHGPAECLLNKVSACAIRELHTDSHQITNVLTCLESIAGSPDTQWRQCLTEAGGKKATIQDCVTSVKGSKLMKAVAAYSKTVGYEYVPWIEVDGRHAKPAEENLTEFLCRRIGNRGPHACAMLSLLDTTHVLLDHQRCFKYPTVQG